MKNKIVILSLAAVVTLVGAGTYIVTRDGTDKDNTNVATQIVSDPKTLKTPAITFSTDKKEVRYNGIEGKTALDTLQLLTKTDIEDSSFGKMVTGINGMQADKTKNYWAFYVNDAYASEGAGTYVSKAGDKITWKLEDIKL
jgi:hypothetical protein